MAMVMEMEIWMEMQVEIWNLIAQIRYGKFSLVAQFSVLSDLAKPAPSPQSPGEGVSFERDSRRMRSETVPRTSRGRRSMIRD